MRRLVALTAVGHVVPAVALSIALARASVPFPWLFGCSIALASVVFFVRRGNVYLRGARRARLAVALVDVPYFIHWTAGLVALPLAVIFVAVALALHRSIGSAIVLAYASAIAIAAYGALRRRWTGTRRVDIAIDGLDARFDGYRIAHLSDLHIGPYTPRAWGMRWARAANALDADLVVVTGDMVSTGTAFHDDIADVVASLRAKDGVLVAMGNHDYPHGDAALVSHLEARGIRVLRNDGVRARASDSALFVAAIDDRASRRDDMERALREKPTDATTILLAHDPADFPAAAARGVDLVLSGHTHGGQLALPFFARHVNLGRIEHRHTLGVYREGASALVVHPGLGTSGPPVRVGAAAAIVEITLRSASSSAR